MTAYRVSFEIVSGTREIIDVYGYDTTMKMCDLLRNQGYKIISIMLNCE